jgi:hypothetical protein
MRKLILTAACATLTTAALAAAQDEPAFSDDFSWEECTFQAWGGNAFFILRPGRQLYYSNQQCVAEGECDELEELWITVLSEVRTIVLAEDGRKIPVRTRVVEEKETVDGDLVEISRNFFSTCRPSNDVYYFGEDVDIYENGEIVSHDGAWLAGRRRAEPGIIMPESAFLLGSRYYQEIAPGVALDRAEHVEFDLELETPAGEFEDCIKIKETSPLEPDAESIKFYCPKVGLVADGDLMLQAIFQPRR